MLFFFVGTEAELIKLFPVIQAAQRENVPFRLIASGQNDIRPSALLVQLGIQPDLILSEEKEIKKSTSGLLFWFLKSLRTTVPSVSAAFQKQLLRGATMVVHGDTISTLLGAWTARRLGMRVAHVEAGLRSRSLLNPFPEEIDRLLVSWCADVSFAPGEVACENLKRSRGKVVNTYYNTVLDSLQYSRAIPCADEQVRQLIGKRYFVFVLHRQENLMQASLVRGFFGAVAEQAKRMPCVCLLHRPTELRLEALGLLENLRDNEHITLLRRKEYFDFIKLLDGAEFVITDGGSNQEELSYMGKPCLILRRRTERTEGLGENAVLYGGDIQRIERFVSTYADYRRAPILPDKSPSQIIIETFQSIGGDNE